MTSISPFAGQLLGSVVQSAGQVPQPYGEWITSKTKRPVSYWFFEVIRTEARPSVASVDVWSTLRTAEVELAYVKLFAVAFAYAAVSYLTVLSVQVGKRN